ncbi:MAG: hypothetical protein V1892_02495 [bacterium]
MGKNKIKVSFEWKGILIKFKISKRAYQLCCCVAKRHGVKLEELYIGAYKIGNGKPTEESLIKYLDLRYQI